MIKSLYVDNYRSLHDFSIDFEKLNLLVGLNGSGKSSVLEVVLNLRRFIVEHMPAGSIFGFEAKAVWRDCDTQSFGITVLKEEHMFEYRATLVFEQTTKQCTVKSERLSRDEHILLETDNGSATVYREDETSQTVLADKVYSVLGIELDSNEYSYINAFKGEMRHIVVCSPRPEIMSEFAQDGERYPDYLMSNITASLMYSAHRHLRSTAELYECVSEFGTGIVNGYLKERGSQKEFILVFDRNGEQFENSFKQLCDGEKMMIALYLLSRGYISNGYTVMIDEPDNFLSLREIQPWCMDVEDAIEEGNGQCVLISHHPEIIDYFAASNGIWMSKTKEGKTIVIDAPDNNIGREDMVYTYSEMIRRGDLDELEQ